MGQKIEVDQGFRVFCIKKETDTAAGEREILVVDNFLSSIPTAVLTFDSIKGEMKWNKS